MTARKHARIEVEQTRFSGVLYGPVRVLQPVIRRVGCPMQYDGLRHAFMVPLQRLDDVLAALETAGYQVDVQMPGWT